jgi:hypothetical protein
MPLAIGVVLLEQPVIDPVSFATVLHDARSSQDAKMARDIRLRKAQRLLEMADAELAMGEERDDAESRVVPERLEESRHGADVEDC